MAQQRDKESKNYETQQINKTFSPFLSKVLTFEYKNGFIIDDEISNRSLIFKEMNNFKTMYSNTNKLIYVTKDGRGYDVTPTSSTLLPQTDILNIDDNKVLQRKEIYIKSQIVEVPQIDFNDQFIKIVSTSNRKISCFLLTSNGKVFIYGANEKFAFGIPTSDNIEFDKFTPHPNLEHVTKKIVDIKCGYSFCVLRCENGDCYGSGYNCYVNIGVTGPRYTDVHEFTLIEELKGRVKQHSCGTFHSIYLTFNGEVYGCGIQGGGEFGKKYKDTKYSYSDCIPLTKLTFNSTTKFKSLLTSDSNSIFISDKNTIIYCGTTVISSFLLNFNSLVVDENTSELDIGLDKYIGDFGMKGNEVVEFGLLARSMVGIIVCRKISTNNLEYFVNNLRKALMLNNNLKDIDVLF